MKSPSSVRHRNLIKCKRNPSHFLEFEKYQTRIRSDDSVPESAYDQAVVCFENIRHILAESGMGPSDVAHVSAYVTDRSYFPEYMRARDEFIGETGRLPSSTLVIVSGFTRPEFKVEVEVWAAAE